MRFADRPRPTQQRLAGAEPVEEGLSRFWQVSTAFNGSQHAHSRLSAARFIGKRANATSNGNALAAHARIQHARTQIEIPRPRRKGARLLSPPLKARAKTKIQLVLQEICDWGSLNKLHLAQNGDFSPQTRGFTRKTPNLRARIVRNRNFLAKSHEKLLRQRDGTLIRR